MLVQATQGGDKGHFMTRVGRSGLPTADANDGSGANTILGGKGSLEIGSRMSDFCIMPAVTVGGSDDG